MGHISQITFLKLYALFWVAASDDYDLPHLDMWVGRTLQQDTNRETAQFL